MTKTPVELGYRWPAEWEPHSATWCAWPHNRHSWPNKFEPVPAEFANMVRTIAEFEHVHILAGRESVYREASRYLLGVRNVTLHTIPTNDAWCRDHGPMFLKQAETGQTAIIDWDYNAWGGKYPPFHDDNAVPRLIAERFNIPRFSPGVVLEGGAVDGNGRGTILTTEKCLLNPNRNGPVTRGRLEQILGDNLGARKVIWLAGGDLAGDDTDGHIDQLARFVGPRTIVVASESDSQDENFPSTALNQRQLQSETDQDGSPFEVVPISLPSPKFQGDQRMPASYMNFYMANGLVIVPQYDDPQDELAVRTLQGLFPDRIVRGLPALNLVWGLGTFHCLTQQEVDRAVDH